MAGTATATYSADVWTSASTIDASPQPWEFSVPVNQENQHRSKSRTSRKSRDRGSKGSRSSSLSKQIYGHEQSHHAPRGRRDASLSRREIENGGVQDTATTPHINASRKSNIKDDEENDENWIHRDKLARIESEELQQAAILFQRQSGTGSTRGRGRSRDHHHGSVGGNTVISATHHEPLEPWPDLQEDQQNDAASSALADGVDITEEERQCWDLRRPEEIAAERESSASTIYRNPGLRKSSSRIPIPTSSPVPLSGPTIDREHFTSRSRAPTDENEAARSIARPRRASEPLTIDSASTSELASESRPGSRGWPPSQNVAPRKTAAKPAATNRKTSTPNPKKASPRSRATSSNANQRPTTRPGESRPPTAINRPEGDPPWLATMYKPDPRLPPDQQILPTHARKMQQEQWEKEGKTPTMYDREFAPLAIAPDQPQPEVKTEKEEEKEAQQPEPLKPEGLGLQPLPRSPDASRPGTSTGYSPMPKVHETPPTGLTPRFNSQTMVTAQGPPLEDEKAGKGCGCCIVM
ncbi:hypothetical protein BDW66DRAFT_76894 [Aspergillus desertorum]